MADKSTKEKWRKMAKGLIKSELKKRDIGYKELAKRLTEVGVEESSQNIANKISRGKFSFSFFLQCMKVIGCRRVTLFDDED